MENACCNQADAAQSVLAIARKLGTVGSGGCRVGLKDQVLRLIKQLRSAMYPDVFSDTREDSGSCSGYVARSLLSAYETLLSVLRRVGAEGEPGALALKFIDSLPEIKETLETDIQAAYEGDPAAKSAEEIMLAYPAFEAISIYRMAHTLYAMSVPILPRMMTEYAHQTTGIDIHPGATIGRYFFIDHGTGVVIGETTTIGERCKLYQGVTLGAKSFEVGQDGVLVKGIKRHPDIGNGVVIYAGATILGGGTVIGDRCVIGGNVWLTHSVKPGETVIAAHGHEQAKSI